jgi:RNA polymerase sigma factor (sigma-70 family)
MASQSGFVVIGPGPDEPGVAPPPPPIEVTPPAGTAPAPSAPGAAGDSSFGNLYLEAFPEMVRLARVLVDSPEIAEDLVQDAFVHLHRHWGGVRDPRAYLRRSVVNACRSHHRRAWRERARLPRAEGGAGRVEPGGLRAGDARSLVDGDAEQQRADDADVLGAALSTLPYRQRAALVLRYYSDLPDADIATVLRCRPGTVASLVHRGLEHLREVVDHDR